MTGPWVPVWVAMMNAAIEATMPTDRSMPPVSIASVWQAARIASGTAARIVDPDPVGGDDARPGDLHEQHEEHEESGQGDERTVAQQPAQCLARRHRAAARDHLGLAAHVRPAAS